LFHLLKKSLFEVTIQRPLLLICSKHFVFKIDKEDKSKKVSGSSKNHMLLLDKSK